MKLTLKNGTEIEVANTSTSTNIVIVEKDFSNVDNYNELFNAENLKGAMLGENELDSVIPTDVKAEKEVGGNVVITLIARKKTDSEIIQERLDEQEDVLNFLLMAREEE